MPFLAAVALGLLGVAAVTGVAVVAGAKVFITTLGSFGDFLAGSEDSDYED